MRERDSLKNPVTPASPEHELLAILKDWQVLDLIHQNGGRQSEYDKAYEELAKQRDAILKDLQ